jgi:NADH-quinone oxidoreductase subunit C
VPVEEVAVESDATCKEYISRLRESLGDRVVEATVNRRDAIVRVTSDAWLDAVTACRKQLGLSYFCFLSGLDWLDNPLQTTRYENVWGSVEEEAPAEDVDDAAPEEVPAPVAEVAAQPAGIRTGLAGGATRFQVFARFASIADKRAVVLKADLDDTDPRVPTIEKIYPGANWHEREAWEMYGFGFDGHSDLKHIYLPGAFEGHPLRKDFPLLAREVKPWPGLTNVEPIAGDASEEGGEAS